MSRRSVLWRDPTVVTLMNQISVQIIKAIAAPRTLWQHLPKAAVQNCRFYTFYSFDNDGRIILDEDRECGSDAIAIEYGREMLTFGGYEKIEICLRNVRVAHLRKSGVDGQSPASIKTFELKAVRREAYDCGAFSGCTQPAQKPKILDEIIRKLSATKSHISVHPLGTSSRRKPGSL